MFDADVFLGLLTKNLKTLIAQQHHYTLVAQRSAEWLDAKSKVP